MQGTKPADCQCNTIIKLVLSYLGFVKHDIDYDLYILQPKPTKGVLIFGYYTDDFLCDYYSNHLSQELIYEINKYLPVTYRECP